MRGEAVVVRGLRGRPRPGARPARATRLRRLRGSRPRQRPGGDPMLSLPPSLKVYLAPGTTDMRRSFDSLAATARTVLEKDPWSGHLFVFCGRRRHIVKVLYADGTGLWL